MRSGVSSKLCDHLLKNCCLDFSDYGDSHLKLLVVIATVKPCGRRTFRELVMIPSHRRRKSPDDKPLGALFARDLDQICLDGKLPPSLKVRSHRMRCVACGVFRRFCRIYARRNAPQRNASGVNEVRTLTALRHHCNRNSPPIRQLLKLTDQQCVRPSQMLRPLYLLENAQISE